MNYAWHVSNMGKDVAVSLYRRCVTLHNNCGAILLLLPLIMWTPEHKVALNMCLSEAAAKVSFLSFAATDEAAVSAAGQIIVPDLKANRQKQCNRSKK